MPVSWRGCAPADVSAIDGYAEARPEIFRMSLIGGVGLPQLWPIADGFEHRLSAKGDYDLFEL